MTGPEPETNEPAHDPEVLQLAAKIFDLARQGDTATVAAYVDAGVPPNLSNDKGDTLLMLAAYHGHADTVRVLLERGGDPGGATTRARPPSPGRCSRARSTWSAPSSRRVRTRRPGSRRRSTRPGCSAGPSCSTSSAPTDEGLDRRRHGLLKLRHPVLRSSPGASG